MHHRRTVGLDIPCQVARLQSLTPLLQARGSLAELWDCYKASGRQRGSTRFDICAGPSRGSPRQDTPVHLGKDALKKSKKIPGVPVENVLTSFFL
jgi:hypothetical protein